MISSIIIPIIVLGVLVVVHEFGHFIAAKMSGVGVLKFSVGFGPSLAKFRHKETEYAIALIPLGGYVRMVGDIPDMLTGPQATDEEVRREAAGTNPDLNAATIDQPVHPEVQRYLADRSTWFLEQSLLTRAWIVFAGPLFNFVLAFVLVAATISIYGREVTDAVVGEVKPGSPAAIAKLTAGDKVRAVNGAPISDFIEMSERIRKSQTPNITLDVERAGQNLQVPVVAEPYEVKNIFGKTEKVYLIGVIRSFEKRPASLIESIEMGAKWTAISSYHTLVGIFGMLFGKVSSDELAGPIFIFKEANRQAKNGMESLLSFMAILSVSLAVLNLLPIPVLFFFFW